MAPKKPDAPIGATSRSYMYGGVRFVEVNSAGWTPARPAPVSEQPRQADRQREAQLEREAQQALLQVALQNPQVRAGWEAQREAQIADLERQLADLQRQLGMTPATPTHAASMSADRRRELLKLTPAGRQALVTASAQPKAPSMPSNRRRELLTLTPLGRAILAQEGK